MPSETPQTSASSPPGEPPRALLLAVRQLLRPLVRLLLEHQITFPVLANLLKSVYVEEAERGFSLPDRPQTISRLTLLTGIHRKDVKRLQTEATGEPTDGRPASVPLGAQLVQRWTTEADYLDPAGAPRALPRLTTPEDGASFESLVASVTQDIRPRAVLDEWTRLGVARIDSEDRVHLVEEAFVPTRGFDEKVVFLGRNVSDHIATAHHNLRGEGAPRFERNVYFARLRPESVDELQDLSRELGNHALREMNQRARALQIADEGHPDARYRMSFGAWFHRAELEEADVGKTDDGNAKPQDTETHEEASDDS